VPGDDVTRVLLTGASGFVGTQVLRALEADGHSVKAVVRERGRLLASRTGIETITTPDLFAEDESWWASTCRDVDTVIHCAWYAEPGKYLQSPKNLACLRGTLALADGCAKAGVKRFVGIGTCFEYDLSAGMLSIRTPLRPSTPYAGCKAAAFLALSNTLPAAGVNFTWCRLFYLHGEGDDERRLVPHIKARLSAGLPAELGTGNHIRDYLDVMVAGRKIADTASAAHTGPINICSGTPITVRQLAERIADKYGRRDLLKFGARQDNMVDPPCVVGVLEPWQ
jgi:nucleoside-diphosphate-sugar epimerase